MLIKAIQYIRPDGERRDGHIDVPDEHTEQVELITGLGLRFGLELLAPANTVNVTLEHPFFGDFNGLIVENGPKVLQAVCTLVEEFDEGNCLQWLIKQKKESDL